MESLNPSSSSLRVLTRHSASSTSPSLPRTPDQHSSAAKPLTIFSQLRRRCRGWGTDTEFPITGLRGVFVDDDEGGGGAEDWFRSRRMDYHYEEEKGMVCSLCVLRIWFRGREWIWRRRRIRGLGICKRMLFVMFSVSKMLWFKCGAYSAEASSSNQSSHNISSLASRLLKLQIRFLIKKIRSLAVSESSNAGSRGGGNASLGPFIFSLRPPEAVALIKKASDILLLESHGHISNKEDIQSVSEFISRQSDILRGRSEYASQHQYRFSSWVLGMSMDCCCRRCSFGFASGKPIATPRTPKFGNLVILQSAYFGCVAICKTELLPAAKGFILKDLPVCYPTTLHESQLQKACTEAFNSMRLKGPAVEIFRQKLEDECTGFWRSEGNFCECSKFNWKAVHAPDTMSVLMVQFKALKSSHIPVDLFFSSMLVHVVVTYRREIDPFDFDSANITFNHFPDCLLLEVVAGSIASDAAFPPLYSRKSCLLRGWRRPLQSIRSLDGSNGPECTSIRDTKDLKNQRRCLIYCGKVPPITDANIYENGNPFLHIGSNLVPVNMNAGGKIKSVPPMKQSAIYVGFEHECLLWPLHNRKVTKLVTCGVIHVKIFSSFHVEGAVSVNKVRELQVKEKQNIVMANQCFEMYFLVFGNRKHL
ncbi:hypothetical protein Scep_005222 [Stephania cephalantha]|uniref:Nonsense-mediated mRNA decay factor SMG8 n=1 Tax=Stephania cephalantha TaxID=152367 RepID=A0AAP0PW56_9MAGN